MIGLKYSQFSNALEIYVELLSAVIAMYLFVLLVKSREILLSRLMCKFLLGLYSLMLQLFV